MIKSVMIEKAPTLEDIITLISNAEVNTRYNFPADFYFLWLKIDVSEDGYCWGMEYNYCVSGYVSYTYPMRNAEYVKVFKTIAGAKRNLIKYFKTGEQIYFKPQTQTT